MNGLLNLEFRITRIESELVQLKQQLRKLQPDRKDIDDEIREYITDGD